MTEATLIGHVPDALARVPGIEIDSVQREVRVAGHVVDLVVIGTVRGRRVRFVVEARAGGYPRDAREAARRVTEAVKQVASTRREEQPIHDVPMIVARFLSPASREMLRDMRVSYWDAGGSLYVDLPWAMYWIDRPAAPRQRRKTQRIFRGSSAQVVHALLLDPGRAWHLTDLAEMADVSVSTAHQVCNALEAQLWMEKEGSGPRTVRRVLEPGSVLDAWAADHSLERYTPLRYYRWTRSSEELLDDVADALERGGIEYALTLSSGARFIAPYATDLGQLWVLVPESAAIEEVASAAGLRPVDEGETVTFFVTRERSPLLFRQRIGDYWVASDIQLYLDLAAWPRRGREQAHHLRAERLQF